MNAISKPAVGDRVKLSARFLRSIGGCHPACEAVGLVASIEDGWLATVHFRAGSLRINVSNLVRLRDVAIEADMAQRIPRTGGA